MPVLLETLDQKIASTLSDWNLYTTLIAVSIVAFLAYPIVYPSEPDTHPLLLARQASAAPVRNKNESAVYRSPEIPHGYPLKSGLNVKQPDEPRWKSGKDGDLRDIWREVLRGGRVGTDGKEVPQGSIMSVFGKEKVEEHDLAQLSKQINVLGKVWKESSQGKVAIYLPNNIEYLVTIFACAFYGLTPVLLPHNLPAEKVYELLNLVNADTLVCEAGTLPIDGVARACQNLRLITSVVPKSNRHMDWTGVPDSAQSRLKIGVWNDILEDNASTASTTLPNNDIIERTGDIVTVWQSTDSAVKPTITTFTQLNVVSAVAALITALPLRQRITPSDLLLPADSFSHTYTLAWTLAALFTHASVAVNSVAGPSATLAAATRLISPTILIASASTLAELHTETAAKITSPLHKLGLFTQSQSLSAGRMPGSSLFLPSASSTNSPGKLRLILTSDRLDADSPPLSSSTLSNLRIFTRARIVYALTASAVFGAVTQTHVFDYRREEGEGHSHFGAPVSSVEIRVVGNGDKEVGKSEPVGELVVSGPAVANGEWRSGKKVEIGEDGCLGYA